MLPCYVLVPERVPAGVAATENRTNSDVIIVRCTNIDPIVSCRNACRLRIINWQVAEDNGVVIHTPLALTHSFLPRRPAYPEAWRQLHSNVICSDIIDHISSEMRRAVIKGMVAPNAPCAVLIDESTGLAIKGFLFGSLSSCNF